jgi:alpha-glucosidase
LTAHDPTRRLFTLNRAFTPGIGRMGVGIWTGDISVSWEAFQRTPATILRWGLAGAFFVACDTGGFEGSASPPDLLARWYQLSSVLPIMRVHSRVQNPPHWPWLYGSAAEQTMRAALTLRYALLPMVYSLAHHAREVGAPLVRPLMYEFPNQEQLAHVSDQFTLGTSLLAAPVLEQNATTRTVVLPRLDTDTTVDAQAEMSPAWFVFNSTTTHAGQQNLSLSGLTLRDFPLFVRGGSILALAPVGAQYVAESHTMGPLEVHVYSGANANFVLVEDDGETTGYATAAATVREFFDSNLTSHFL